MTRDPVRDEAERLVAAAIAAVSMAARGLSGAGSGRGAGGFATGSPECCVCPVCRVIAAMREPGVDVADRLAGSAGDLASGVASMLRAFARGSDTTTGDERGREGDEFWESLRRRARAGGQGETGGRSDEDDAWRAATAAPGPAATPPPRKPMAKKAVAKRAPRQPAPDAVPPATPVAKKAVAKKAAPKKAVAKAAPKKAAPKKAAPKKAAPPAGAQE
jgi:hypothetical protein